MGFFEKLIALVSIPKVLENLTGAIRDAAKTKRGQGELKEHISAEIRFPKAVEEAYDAAQKKQIRIQGVIAVCSFLAFVAAAIYAGIAYRQWQEIHKQTVSVSRAWLGFQQQPDNLPVVIDHVQIVPHFIVQGHYTIENVGNGPAIKVNQTPFVETDTKLIMVKRTAAFICNAGSHFATGTVPMGPGLENPGPMGFVLLPKQIYSHSFTWSGNDPQPGLKWVYVMGCVAYLDQFKTPHWTRFVVLIGDGVSPVSDASPRQLYSLYNDTDETDETGGEQPSHQ